MQQQVFKSALSNKAFFNYFNEVSENVVAMANLLFEAIGTDGDMDQKPQFAHIGRLRAQSGEVRHAVFVSSGKVLISPFERNDMTDLANAIDTVAGYINIASRRINLYLPAQITPDIKELAGLIVELAYETAKCVKSLENLRNADAIIELCDNIEHLEHYADKVYNKAVANVLEQEQDAIELIKHTEILHALETTTDKCQRVAEVIKAIMVKNS